MALSHLFVGVAVSDFARGRLPTLRWRAVGRASVPDWRLSGYGPTQLRQGYFQSCGGGGRLLGSIERDRFGRSRRSSRRSSRRRASFPAHVLNGFDPRQLRVSIAQELFGLLTSRLLDGPAIPLPTTSPHARSTERSIASLYAFGALAVAHSPRLASVPG